jgi:hypothetical protein
MALVELIEATLAVGDEVMFAPVRVPMTLTVVEELEELPAELVRVVTELVVMAVLLIVANDDAAVVLVVV